MMIRPVAAASLAALTLAGCTSQAPTDTAGPVMPTATDAETGRAPTCADWNLQGHGPDPLPSVTPAGLNPADTAKFLTGLGNYCRALPDDVLVVAVDSVVQCLWPVVGPNPLRGPDCAAVRGRS
jgi:hypothetical protein